MDFPPSRALEDNGRLGTGAGPLLALVLIGLLADLARPEEAYAGIGYGLSLLALLGAAGYAARLTGRLATRLDPLPWASPAAPAARASTLVQGASARGEGWPLLVALLFGQLAVLISDLGGWV
jgi:hypothetical protein